MCLNFRAFNSKTENDIDSIHETTGKRRYFPNSIAI